MKLCWEVPRRVSLPAVLSVPNSILMTNEVGDDGSTYKYYGAINSVIDTWSEILSGQSEYLFLVESGG